MDILSFVRAKHNLIFKLIVVTGCSLLLTWMVPAGEIRGHRVDRLTTIWPYEDIVPRQDFLIRKTDGEIAEEKKTLIGTSPLFFEHSDRDKGDASPALTEIRKNDENLFFKLDIILQEIYSRGIIENIEELQTGRPVYLINGSYAESIPQGEYFTISSAATYLSRELAKLNVTRDFSDLLSITYFYNRKKSDEYMMNKLEQVSLYKNVVRAGQAIVRKGETLNDNKRFLINRYFYDQNRSRGTDVLNFLARWAMMFALSLVLLVFLAFFRQNVFGQNSQVVFLYMMLVATVFATWLFYHYGFMVMMLPFPLVPILVRVFFDSRTALFTHLMIVLCCAFFMPDKLEFLIIEVVTGIGTLFAVAEMRKRQQILNAALLVLMFYVVLFVSYQVGFGAREVAFKLESYVPFAISAMLVLLAYPLIYLTERFFGFISDFRLLELCDLNQPLLRRLSTEVPGTFQHSLQVANLAEEAIYFIGGNPLLVRAGAMYHDIGKLHHPNYFTENQANGFSPHMEMEPIESARIIINHVILGVELAKKYKLPEQVIDFIRTHHGTTTVQYFLDLFRKKGVESKIAESQFRYPGPIPFSRETAVLMIADGVEAASRSLREHNAVTINDMVDYIIDYKIANNQFINADITFKDITTIRKIFKKRLMNIYHARIEYPS